jgi:hypothetical protein
MSLQLNGTIGVIGPVNEGFVTATGSTTARNLDDRFADVVNVKDFGASPSASASTNTAAIQAAIDYASASASRSCVFIPPGFYFTNASIIVNSSISITGCNRSRTSIVANHAGDGIVFQSVNGGRLSNISITRTTSDNTGSAIWMNRSSNMVLDDIAANNHQYNIRISGGQLNLLSNIYVYNFSPFTYNSTGASILLEAAGGDGGSFQPCYTVSINNIVGSASDLLPNIIRVHYADGLNINNGYFNFSTDSLFTFERSSINDQIIGVNLSNLYFDGGPQSIKVDNLLPAGNEGARHMSLTNCFIANQRDFSATDRLVNIKRYVTEMQFSNCQIRTALRSYGIRIHDEVSGPSNGRYKFTGNAFANLSPEDGGGAVYAKNVECISFCGNTFTNTSSAFYEILIDGTVDTVSAIGNITDGTPPMFLSSIATINRNMILLNAGDSIGNIVSLALPTSSAGLPSGSMWNNAGDVKIVP